MDKAFVAKRVVAKLHSTEKTVDSALLEVSELVAELINARREMGLSTTVADKEIAGVMEALGAIEAARASLVKSHKGMGRIAGVLRIHVPTTGKIPDVSDGEGDSNILRVAS